jgi:predicted N-acetyltransferase YhbS
MALSMSPVLEHLTDGLLLHSIRDARDAERFAVFNGAVNGADQGATCAALLNHHPAVDRAGFLMVEDERTGEVVSTTCLIPWRCMLDGVPLEVAMLEMVVTHPGYRRRGLVRAQIDHFHRSVAGQGYDLSIIEGIPYYYRQFGYAYAGDHWTTDGLPAAWVPGSVDTTPVRLRPAGEADLPALQQLYAAGVAALPSHTLRSAEYWRYLIHAVHYPVYLVEPAGEGQAEAVGPLGYVCGWRGRDDPRTLILMESSIQAATTALAVLQVCKQTADVIWLGWPASSTLVQVGRSLGASRVYGDQWLLRITNLPQLLAKLGPLLARRLAHSPWAGLTDSLILNLYRQAYRLRFVKGALAGVDSLGFVDASMGADGGDLCIPPEAFTRLLLGYRTLKDLYDAWPDIVIPSARHHLLDVLFPRVESYFWMPYMHCGHLGRIIEER